MLYLESKWEFERTIMEQNEMVYVPLDEVVANPKDNMRFFPLLPQKRAEMKASIKRDGLIEPIVTVRKGKGYKVVAGFQRFELATELKLKTIPIVIRPGDSDHEALNLAENLHRANLSPMELGLAIRKLMETRFKDIPVNEAATKVAEMLNLKTGTGKPAVTTVFQYRKFADLPRKLQEAVHTGLLKKQSALFIADLPIPDKDKEALMDEAEKREWAKQQPVAVEEPEQAEQEEAVEGGDVAEGEGSGAAKGKGKGKAKRNASLPRVPKPKSISHANVVQAAEARGVATQRGPVRTMQQLLDLMDVAVEVGGERVNAFHTALGMWAKARMEDGPFAEKLAAILADGVWKVKDSTKGKADSAKGSDAGEAVAGDAKSSDAGDAKSKAGKGSKGKDEAKGKSSKGSKGKAKPVKEVKEDDDSDDDVIDVSDDV